MATPQRPLGSGFGWGSTATEVLAGLDLTGKRAVITGGYSGIGLETTKALVAAGATAVVPARRRSAAEEALEGLDGVRVEELDLGDLESVRAFAEGLLADGEPIDLLIGNAGIMATPETRVGPGWEAQLATNHLGHFALANRLWPLLAAAPSGARVVALSSRGHKFGGGIEWDDLQLERGYDKWRAYGQAKTANVLFAVHLDALGAQAGVRALAVHPGGIMTPLQRHLSREEMVERGWVDEDGTVLLRFKTPEQGAATTVWAATSPQLDGQGGVYCEDGDVAARTDELDEDEREARGVEPFAIDPDAAARLWAISAELTGVDAFARAA